VRTQGPLVFGADGICRAKCYWCGKPVEVPLELSECVEVPEERFVLAQGSGKG